MALVSCAGASVRSLRQRCVLASRAKRGGAPGGAGIRDLVRGVRRGPPPSVEVSIMHAVSLRLLCFSVPLSLVALDAPAARAEEPPAWAVEKAPERANSINVNPIGFLLGY